MEKKDQLYRTVQTLSEILEQAGRERDAQLVKVVQLALAEIVRELQTTEDQKAEPKEEIPFG